jgi:hypothetical protein
MHISSVTRSDATQSTSETPVFLPAEQIQVGFIPGSSISNLAHDDMKDLAKSAGYQTG